MLRNGLFLVRNVQSAFALLSIAPHRVHPALLDLKSHFEIPKHRTVSLIWGRRQETNEPSTLPYYYPSSTSYHEASANCAWRGGNYVRTRPPSADLCRIKVNVLFLVR